MKTAPLLLAFPMVLAACADVIGIDEYSVGWECALETPAAGSGTCIVVSADGAGGSVAAGGGSPLQSACNPVNNAGCTAQEAVCSPDATMTSYACAERATPPAALCGDCSEALCGPGTLCVTFAGVKRCVQMCCADTDCGSGTCDAETLATTLPGGVGLCIQ